MIRVVCAVHVYLIFR